MGVPVHRGAADHRLHLLLHGGSVQPGRPGRQPAQIRRLHPRYSSRGADRSVPRPRPDAADAARLAVPRDHRCRPVDLHQGVRLLAGDRPRARRHLRADRRRRRPRHHASDGVADDDAELRGLLEMNLLVLGPQGAGKGTQAKRISAEYGIPHVSTGDMFRAEQEPGTDFGRRVGEIMATGQLVPDELTIAMIEERLGRDDARDGFVLDGFPRNLAQAEALDAMLGGIGRVLDAILFFDVPDEVGMARALNRAQIEQRVDDTPEVIRKRLEIYHSETEPIVEHYRVSGKLVPLHGARTIEEVWSEIAEALNQIAPLKGVL